MSSSRETDRLLPSPESVAPSAAAPSASGGAPGFEPGAAPGVPATSNAFSQALARMREYAGSVLKQDLFSQQKPWSEVVDRTALSKPANLGEAISRIKKNTAYFKVNYSVAVLATCMVTFLMNPSSLLVLGVLVAAWAYFIFVKQGPLVISGRQISDREKLLGLSAISFITVFFLTSVGTVILSALGFSLAVIMLHGAFREPDSLFVDELETQQPATFYSILTATPVPGTTGPANV